MGHVEDGDVGARVEEHDPRRKHLIGAVTDVEPGHPGDGDTIAARRIKSRIATPHHLPGTHC